ncbi:penicillin acylase family protein [Thalassotalea marina]|nr:penicillin acylase family protein [Thalassotalea marina]
MQPLKKFALVFLSLFIFAFITLATWLYSKIDGSLPILDGKFPIYGLTDTVDVMRDANGVPTIKGTNRLDVAVATGFIHAQERFFQMDLLRRNAAGELSSLFGDIAFKHDKSVRVHRFRQRAQLIVNQLSSEQKAILAAYTQGVNSGLKYLNTNPFEYLLLQQDPVEWREEDTILTVFSMYLDLQQQEGTRERVLGLMKSVFSDPVYQFLNPKGSKWDAALDNSTYSSAPLPELPWPAARSETTSRVIDEVKQQYNSEEFPGSNNWAVAGSVSKTGSAIVANDMHLGIRVPNTWFRASFEYQVKQQPVKVTGVTLPGTPLIVAGSNGQIAWGFTNSYGDYSDVIKLELNNDGQYLTPEGYLPFTEHKHVVAIKDKPSRSFTTKETIWGPVIGKNAKGELLAYKWIAHHAGAVNLASMELESATNVKQSFSIAHKAGIPSQNMVVGDKQGNIGWTIMGPIPNRNVPFGETPESWATGQYLWQGLLSGHDYPQIYNPINNRIWTANSRVIGGEDYKKLGNGGYALGARAQQIRDNLFKIEVFDEQALLSIALDDKALFLSRWQEFVLTKVLTEEVIKQHPQWQQAKDILSSNNSLSATVDSVGYRLVRNFRIALRDRVFSVINDNLSKQDQAFNLAKIRHQLEQPLWQLVNEQPDNFMWQPDETWQDTFVKAFTITFNDMTAEQPLAKATWGQQNTAKIEHPMAKAIPFFGKWLNMPASPLAGDSYMPRVQGKAFGASERMVVSPGHEETGIFHMPTSQSGHPWSPYFGKGHQDWVDGKATPFLPQQTRYTLTLLSY